MWKQLALKNAYPFNPIINLEGQLFPQLLNGYIKISHFQGTNEENFLISYF